MSEQSSNPGGASAIEAQIAARAWKDQAFKRQLLSNPQATLEREFGIRLPEGAECRVLEETSQTTYLILPMPPEQAGFDQLSEEELEAVAGGAPSKTDVRSGCVCCGIKPPA